MISRSTALEYFKNQCRQNGVDEQEAEARMAENDFQYTCYTGPKDNIGGGVTAIHKASGEVFNFGSNPVFWPLTDATSEAEFDKAVTEVKTRTNFSDFTPTPRDTIEEK